jgi:hypothetical protein
MKQFDGKKTKSPAEPGFDEWLFRSAKFPDPLTRSDYLERMTCQVA